MTGSADLLAKMRAKHQAGEDVREVVALAVAGMAGQNWHAMDEYTRDLWRMAAAEVVEFARCPYYPEETDRP